MRVIPTQQSVVDTVIITTKYNRIPFQNTLFVGIDNRNLYSPDWRSGGGKNILK